MYLHSFSIASVLNVVPVLLVLAPHVEVLPQGLQPVGAVRVALAPRRLQPLALALGGHSQMTSALRVRGGSRFLGKGREVA